MTRLVDAVPMDTIRAAFLSAHAVHEGRRQEQARIEEELEQRRRRPMTNTINGLGDQIDAALAAVRHAQDKALAERRREKELAAAQDEARQSRRGNSRIGG
jgi:hypothetical protein